MMNTHEQFVAKRLDRSRLWRLRDAVRGMVGHAFDVSIMEVRYGLNRRDVWARVALMGALARICGLRDEAVAELCDCSVPAVVEHLGKLEALKKNDDGFRQRYLRVAAAAAELVPEPVQRPASAACEVRV